MLNPGHIVSRDARTASRVIAGEAIILTPQDSRIRNLNETGSRIWELLAEKPTVEALVQRIHTEFDVTEEQARADVTAFVEQLVAAGLATVSAGPAPGAGA
jgi:hypothetical protein